MLRFLLDEHVSPDVARGLRKRRPDIPVVSLQEFVGGSLLGAGDNVLLSAARVEGRVLVTYDRRTVWPLLREWYERGDHHAGVVFVSRSAYPSRDVGALIDALEALWGAQSVMDWTDRAVYL